MRSEAIRTLVGVAEEALEAIKERDRLVDLRSATGDVVYPIGEAGGLRSQDDDMTDVVSASSNAFPCGGRDRLPA